ncbi:uncharacterized protein [Spinacia oleracea]|uniref:phosphoglycerate kinase n=1 Tax=Spinacia oleracea TaxID=3562 RepID=A0ABM3R4U9_SPIOL|nr:uncharacterized protein LOC130465817 [Spinacia oleracea]XP_056690641.1 uncharacterized protein LOC130465817 [Spinacia oleracea]
MKDPTAEVVVSEDGRGKVAEFHLLHYHAFGTAHRAHASTEGVAKYLKPSVAGFLMQKGLKRKKVGTYIATVLKIFKREGSSEEMAAQSPPYIVLGGLGCKVVNHFCASLLEDQMSPSATLSCDLCCVLVRRVLFGKSLLHFMKCVALYSFTVSDPFPSIEWRLKSRISIL